MLQDLKMSRGHNITVSACAINTHAAALKKNFEAIAKAYKRATHDGAELVLMPELSLSGYGCEDLFFWPDFIEGCHDALKRLAKITKGGSALFVGAPTAHRNALYNGVFALADGKIVGGAAKQKLAGDGVHYEPRWFKPWTKGLVVEHSTLKVPFGDLLFKINDICIAVEICEDAWSADRKLADYARQGVDLILNPAASHYAFNKHKRRARIALETSRVLQVGYVQANILGCESGRLIYDGATVIAAGGELIGEGERLSLAEFSLVTSRIKIKKLRLERRKIFSFPKAEKVASNLISLYSRAKHSYPPALNNGSESHMYTGVFGDFTRCITLALFDYIRKSGAKGAVVSLSGGADSAAVSIAVALTYLRAHAEQQLGRLFINAGRAKKGRDLVKERLICIYQVAENSSQKTEAAAKDLAESLAADFYTFDVQPHVASYINLIKDKLKIKPSWKEHDLALQNIQARTRGPAPWLAANLKDYLMLTTSNRSEGAVGYCTIDGDTCGGLAPLAGLDKPFILRWLNWIKDKQLYDLDLKRSISKILSFAPTAELKPKKARQSDEGDLMPYQALDFIERAILIEHHSQEEIVGELVATKLAPSAKVARGYLKKFLTLFRRSQWKRERLAPSFHFDDHNLDPRSWLRFPILAGELEFFG